MKQSFKSKNIDRATFLVRVIAARDGALLDELIESLRCMPATDAHQILDAADAAMPIRDRVYWEAFLEVCQAVRDEVEPFICVRILVERDGLCGGSGFEPVLSTTIQHVSRPDLGRRPEIPRIVTGH